MTLKELKISELEPGFWEIRFKKYPNKGYHNENILDEKETNLWSMFSL